MIKRKDGLRVYNKKPKTTAVIKYKKPSTKSYSPMYFDKICDKISNGMSVPNAVKTPMRGALSEEKRSITAKTFYTWVRKDINGCAKVYALALLIKQDVMFDKLIDISDEVAEDQISIAKARLRIDTRKWHLQKSDPVRYSDKMINEHSGLGGRRIEIKHISEMSDHEIEENIAILTEDKEIPLITIDKDEEDGE